MKLSPTLLKRFNTNTARAENGCLLWAGLVTPAGYGLMSIATGVSRGPHHVAWFLAKGAWPKRLRHTCDTPTCCEETHLLEGSQAQNMSDKVERGRQAFGMKHGMAKLPWDSVCEIRRLRAEGVSLKALADRFQTCQSNVSTICLMKTRTLG